MPNNRKFRDCSALSVTCFKIVMTTTYFWPPIRFFASRWNSILHNSAKKTYHFTLQLKFLVSLLSKPKEILDWNVCQVTVTESIVVFLQSRSSIYIFTDSLFFFCVYSHPFAFVFIEPFPNFFREVRSLKWPLQSRISLSAYSQWFCFFFWTTRVCWNVSNF